MDMKGFFQVVYEFAWAKPSPELCDNARQIYFVTLLYNLFLICASIALYYKERNFDPNSFIYSLCFRYIIMSAMMSVIYFYVWNEAKLIALLADLMNGLVK